MVPSSLIAATLAAALAASAWAGGGTASVTLDEAIGRALVANRTLATAAIAAQAEESSLAAAMAEFELKIIPMGTFGRIGSNAIDGTAYGANSSLGVRLSRKFETGTVVAIGPAYNRSGAERNSTMNVSLSQPLFRGRDVETTLDGVRRAEHTSAASRRAHSQARVNAALEAIGAYYEVVKLARGLEFSLAQRGRLERHLLLARSKERTGLIDAMDLYRAELRLRDAQEASNRAEQALEAARNRLRLALDLGLDAPLALADPPAPPAAPGDAEEEALRNRIEIAQLRAEYDEARRGADIAAKALQPDVALQVNYGQAWTSDPFLAQYLPTTQRQWSVNLQASTDWARTLEKANLQRALLRVEVARLALEARSAEIRNQVRLQRSAVQEAQARIAIRRSQIHQAEGKLALAELKFLHDLASNLDVLDAEGELQRAQASLRDAETEHAVGIYNLRALAGRLL